MSDIFGKNEPLHEVVCNKCKHYYWGEKPGDCDAFDEIPKGIILGDIKHDKPIAGQKNDIVFEPAS